MYCRLVVCLQYLCTAEQLFVYNFNVLQTSCLFTILMYCRLVVPSGCLLKYSTLSLYPLRTGKNIRIFVQCALHYTF